MQLAMFAGRYTERLGVEFASEALDALINLMAAGLIAGSTWGCVENALLDALLAEGC